MKKIVVEITLSSKDSKRGILKTVAKLNGIKSMNIDEKLGRLTVVGTVDPVDVIEALRKKGKTARIVSVGQPGQEKQTTYIQPYYYWNNEPRPMYPYYNYSDPYKPVQYGGDPYKLVQYGSAPYEEQPSGCVIL